MAEFPRQPHEFLIPREISEKLLYFPASNNGYPRLKPEYNEKILQKLKEVYPSFKRYIDDQGAIVWFESDTPYIDVSLSVIGFAYAFFDILGPEVLKQRKRLNVRLLNQQDLATLVATESPWKEKAIQETLRRIVFSTTTSIKHHRHFVNVFLDILRAVTA